MTVTTTPKQSPFANAPKWIELKRIDQLLRAMDLSAGCAKEHT